MDGADFDLLDPDLLATGVLPFVAIVAALLTAPVALFLLWLYRRAVLRAMAASSADAPFASPVLAPIEPPSAAPPVPLRIERLVPGGDIEVSPRAAAASRALSRGLVGSAVVYTLGALAFASVVTAAWMAQVGDGFVLTRLLWLLVAALWPLVLTLDLAVATTRGERLLVVAGYVSLVVVVGAYAIARNTELSAGDLAAFWLITNGPPTVVLLAFLVRRVRAVGPLVLAFMLVAGTGAQLALMLLGSSDRVLEAVVDAAVEGGFGAIEVLIAAHVVGFAGFGVLGWWLLGRLGATYRMRDTSDLAITLDAMWLTFGLVGSMVLAADGWPWIVTGLVAFVAWLIVTRAGFRVATRGRPRRGDEHSLLLLRVFALGDRSQRALDALAKRWRQVGTIEMIAGPDLVTAVVEPHEFLDFVGGRLSRRFVRGERDLSERLHSRDRGPDPDGRYRINEFFCHADTWEPTMRRLARDADVVLMDLRRFSPGNEGCIVELEHLLGGVPLDRVLLLEDETTDEPFLRETLHELWERLPAASPNRAVEAPRLRIVQIGNEPAEAMASVVRLMLDVALTPLEESRAATVVAT